MGRTNLMVTLIKLTKLSRIPLMPMELDTNYLPKTKSTGLQIWYRPQINLYLSQNGIEITFQV